VLDYVSEYSGQFIKSVLVLPGNTSYLRLDFKVNLSSNTRLRTKRAVIFPCYIFKFIPQVRVLLRLVFITWNLSEQLGIVTNILIFQNLIAMLFSYYYVCIKAIWRKISWMLIKVPICPICLKWKMRLMLSYHFKGDRSIVIWPFTHWEISPSVKPCTKIWGDCGIIAYTYPSNW